LWFIVTLRPETKVMPHIPATRKIINDPVHGFITVPFPSVFAIMEHPHFQRLRRIKQLGLTHLVYPGAMHTRFNHTIGAVHLMGLAIEELRGKGYAIDNEEAEAATLAILLHDIGHGPFSHALEHSIASGAGHELLSSLFMDRFNQQFNGRLDMAIAIFKDRYSKKFLHQLVSSQLDVDRLDYLKRDSFFTGVSEGIVGSDRILKMLHVVDDTLAVESKGIYSVEKFIVARRIMYWQVYLHKTVLSAEYLLIRTLLRAKQLAEQGQELFATPALRTFLYRSISPADMQAEPELLDRFAELDDFDVLTSVKVWKHHSDKVLSRLSHMLVDRDLLKIKVMDAPLSEVKLTELRERMAKEWGVSTEDAAYFVFSDTIRNSAYTTGHDRINILYKDGTIKDITEASDAGNISVLSKPVEKHFLCFPTSLRPFL
jgi:HD superfamily phosphohydrolase